MQDRRSTSPAVVSLQDEQARQRPDQSDLNKGLEDTFPASDPVSQTVTTTAGSNVSFEGQDSEPAPRVDQALAAVNARNNAHDSDFAYEEMQAMRTEVNRVVGSTREIASASGRVTRSGLDMMRTQVRDGIRARPVAAVGLAAVIGFLFGISR